MVRFSSGSGTAQEKKQHPERRALREVRPSGSEGLSFRARSLLFRRRKLFQLVKEGKRTMKQETKRPRERAQLWTNKQWQQIEDALARAAEPEIRPDEEDLWVDLVPG